MNTSTRPAADPDITQAPRGPFACSSRVGKTLFVLPTRLREGGYATRGHLGRAHPALAKTQISIDTTPVPIIYAEVPRFLNSQSFEMDQLRSSIVASQSNIAIP